MIKIRGNARVTDNMDTILRARAAENEIKYLSTFQRIVDPLIIGIFYGLYKSKDLPPLDMDIYDSDKVYEFNVNIDALADIFNHFLLCLWLYKNGMPQDDTEILSYRKKLYEFIIKILDVDFYRNVLIPFYLSKADEPEANDPSYLYRLYLSKDVGIDASTKTPEYLSMEFNTFQNDFMNQIIKPLIENIKTKTNI